MSKLLSLSMQLYLLSRDKQFRSDMSKLISFIKRKAMNVVKDLDTDKQEALYSAYQRLEELKTAIETKMEEAVHGLYGKMHIAHTSEVTRVSDDLAKLTSEFNLLAERLTKLEQEKK